MVTFKGFNITELVKPAYPIPVVPSSLCILIVTKSDVDDLPSPNPPVNGPASLGKLTTPV